MIHNVTHRNGWAIPSTSPHCVRLEDDAEVNFVSIKLWAESGSCLQVIKTGNTTSLESSTGITAKVLSSQTTCTVDVLVVDHLLADTPTSSLG